MFNFSGESSIRRSLESTLMLMIYKFSVCEDRAKS